MTFTQPPGGSSFITPPQPELTPHSGLGIASFILGMLSGGIVLVTLIVTAVMQAGGDTFDEESPHTIIVGLVIIGAILLSLLGFALGLAGTLTGGRRKLFAILGLIFSILVGVGTLGLILIGLAIG